MSRSSKSIVLVLSLAALVAACAPSASSVSSLASPETSPGDAASILPVAEPTNEAITADSIPTADPTPTAEPSPTAAPTPTAEPSPSAYPTGSLPRAGASAPLIRFGSRADKVIAITVDDCYSPKAVAADLAIFERYHVNVTWFPIGYVAAIYPDLWREVDAAGFPIANHTFDHKNLTVMSYAEVLAEIRDDNKTLKDIIGHPIMPFVRPMGGSYNGTVLAAAHAAGELAVVNWDTTDGDTSGGFASWSNVGRLTTMGEGGKAGSIILMHANHEYTTAALPAIIEYYRARGFQFVTLGQLLGVPGPVPYGPEPSDWQPAPLPSPSPTSAPSLPY